MLQVYNMHIAYVLESQRGRGVELLQATSLPGELWGDLWQQEELAWAQGWRLLQCRSA